MTNQQTVSEVLCELAGCWELCSYKKENKDAVCPAIRKALTKLTEIIKRRDLIPRKDAVNYVEIDEDILGQEFLRIGCDYDKPFIQSEIDDYCNRIKMVNPIKPTKGGEDEKSSVRQ